jgi:multicomponent K+:H+ antiporter subunit D
MTKVGIYAALRLSFLLFGVGAGASAGLGDAWLLYGGMATLVFGMLGIIAVQDVARMVGFAVLISTGTLLTAIGVNRPAVTAGALFYLVISVFSLGAFYLLIELVERGREFGADMLAVTREVFGEADAVDDEQDEHTGPLVPAMMAILGISFIACTLLISGLPPLAGFVAKFAILSGLLHETASSAGVASTDWIFIALLILSGLLALIAMCRAGMRILWSPDNREVPRVKLFEIVPVVGLLLACVGLTIWAGPVLAYMEATARALHDPAAYVSYVAPQTGPPSAETAK